MTWLRRGDEVKRVYVGLKREGGAAGAEGSGASDIPDTTAAPAEAGATNATPAEAGATNTTASVTSGPSNTTATNGITTALNTTSSSGEFSANDTTAKSSSTEHV